MKRVILVALAFLLLLGLFQLGLPKPVMAGIVTKTKIAGLALDVWHGGENTTVDFTKNPAPSWLQLLTDPVKVTTPGEICHDFRGGQFYWKGEIRQLKDSKWVKIPSTAGWVPTTEGIYMICADAPSAGTYALFGYFDPPPGVVLYETTEEPPVPQGTPTQPPKLK